MATRRRTAVNVFWIALIGFTLIIIASAVFAGGQMWSPQSANVVYRDAIVEALSQLENKEISGAQGALLDAMRATGYECSVGMDKHSNMYRWNCNPR